MRRIWFASQRSDETGISYGVRWSGSCRGGGGQYIVDGDQIRVFGGVSMTLELRFCEDDARRDDAVFADLMYGAETWSLQGAVLSITNVDGVPGAFREIVDTQEGEVVGDGLEAVTPRLHFVDETGFMVRIQEQEAADGFHEAENVAWIGWSSGAVEAADDGFAWQTEAVVTPNSWDFYRRSAGPDSFAAIRFPSSFQDLCLLADMNTLHGLNTASIRYRLTRSGAEVLVDEEGSSSMETGHTDEVVRSFVVDCSVTDYPAEVYFGRVEEVRDEWQLVEFRQPIVDPVVVAGPASLNGSDPGVVEVRNINSLSFEMRFHEWDYLDGVHPTGETVSYVVVERGVTILASGARIEAGTTTATVTLAEVRFAGALAAIPVLLTTVVR